MNAPHTCPDALKYVLSLMRKNYEAVGFLPAPRIEDYFLRRQVWLQYENNEPCGYLIFGNGHPVLKVYQCCIQTDAQHLQHATALIRRLEDVAADRGCSSISLWCADDLNANSFWRAYGFINMGTRRGGTRRGRSHNNWVLPIKNSRQMFLFSQAEGYRLAYPESTSPNTCPEGI